MRDASDVESSIPMQNASSSAKFLVKTINDFLRDPVVPLRDDPACLLENNMNKLQSKVPTAVNRQDISESLQSIKKAMKEQKTSKVHLSYLLTRLDQMEATQTIKAKHSSISKEIDVLRASIDKLPSTANSAEELMRGIAKGSGAAAAEGMTHIAELLDEISRFEEPRKQRLADEHPYATNVFKKHKENLQEFGMMIGRSKDPAVREAALKWANEHLKDPSGSLTRQIANTIIARQDPLAEIARSTQHPPGERYNAAAEGVLQGIVTL